MTAPNQEEAEILTKAISVAEKTGHWLSGQLPQVLHQLIEWTVIKGVIGTIVLSAFIAISVFVTRFLLKKMKNAPTYSLSELDKTDIRFVAVLTEFVMILAGFIVISIAGSAAMNGLQAIITPKLFILQYVASLTH